MKNRNQKISGNPKKGCARKMQKRNLAWVMSLMLAAVIACTGCNQIESTEAADSTDSSTAAAESGSENTDSKEDTGTTVNGETLSAIESGEIGVEADEDDLTATYDSFDAEITLSDDNSTVSGDDSGVTITDNLITITAGGTYRLTGELSDGQVLVTGTEKVKLYLDGVTITNSTGPALLCVNEKRTIISLAEGTENTISDGSSYDVYTVEEHEIDQSAIYAQDKLTINGSGSLIVNGNCGDGIIL